MGRAGLGVVALVVAVPAVGLSAGSFRVVLASQNSHGVSATGDSSTEGTQLVSGDGHLVAFDSASSNLPGGDGSIGQVYVRNFTTHKTLLISVTRAGDPAGSTVSTLGMTPDGRFVSLEGTGVGLPGADGTNSQVWLRDLKANRTILVSRANTGAPGDGGSGNPWVTPDGRYVEFGSNAANLPGGDGTSDRIYVRDLKLRKTILVSVNNAGMPATGEAYGELLSADGRFAAFYSTDPGLPGGATEHVYLRDLVSKRTTLVDRNSDGQIASASTRIAAISADGDYVAFTSTATNLPGGDGVHQQIYLRDRKTGKTTLISRDNAGQPQDGNASDARISSNDRLVAFESDAPNLDGGTSTYQVYLRDRKTGRTRLVSHTGFTPGNSASYYPSISPDARWVTFDTLATNLGATSPRTAIVRAGPTG
jgi:Tol biopolymer transport system component